MAQNVPCDCSANNIFQRDRDHSIKKFPSRPKSNRWSFVLSPEKIFNARWSLRAQIYSHRELKCYHHSPAELARNRINNFSPLIFSKMRPVTQSLTVLLPFLEDSFRHNPLASHLPNYPDFTPPFVPCQLWDVNRCEPVCGTPALSVSPKCWTNGGLSSCSSLREKKRSRFCGAFQIMAEIQKESQAQALYPTPCWGRGRWMSQRRFEPVQGGPCLCSHLIATRQGRHGNLGESNMHAGERGWFVLS